MSVIKDDWEKTRSNGNPLTDAEIAKIKVAFNCGRKSCDIARELKCSSRTAAKYYSQFRGKPHQTAKPKYRELIHVPAPRPAPPKSRFYKSNFEL